MSKINSIIFLYLLCIITLAISPLPASAAELKSYQDGEIIVMNGSGEKGTKNYSITVLLWHESPNDLTALQGVIEGFQILGLPCTLTIRQLLENEQKAKDIIAELKNTPPDLIYAMGTEMTTQVMREIHDTPIVFTAVTNPVLSGITPDWKSSGRNITGNSNWIQTSVILKTFKETVPALKKLGVMYDPDNNVSSMEVVEAKRKLNQDTSLAIELVTSKVQDKSDLRAACQLLLDQGVDAVWVPVDILIYRNLSELLPLTVPAKIPLLASSHRDIENGSMVGLVVDYIAMGKKSVVQANKILSKGIKPRDIPICTMSDFQKIINLEAAERIGYEIPLGVVASADKIIE